MNENIRYELIMRRFRNVIAILISNILSLVCNLDKLNTIDSISLSIISKQIRNFVV